MSSGTETKDFASYKGKMVELTYRVTGSEEPVTVMGRITAGNHLGLMFKPKSQRTEDLINAEDILDVEEVVSPRLRLVTQKKLRTPSEANVKRHLADYHGMSLTELNGMSEAEAMRRHGEINHADLGHEHSEEVMESASEGRQRQSRDDILRRVAEAGTRRSA